MNNLMPILIIILLAGIGVMGDYFIKLSGNGPKYINHSYFLIGIAMYALTAFGWFYVMKHIKLSTLGIFYSITTVILLALVGTIFFKEHLNAYEIIGITLGIASLVILARFR
jgi:small multidrug resistance pump